LILITGIIYLLIVFFKTMICYLYNYNSYLFS